MTIPIPRDLPLPLPASAFYLEPLLVVAFIAHILFVNLLVGSSILVLGLELRGRKDVALDRLAHALARTITVNKSLAVVLGVAPLLVISVLYTMHFYTANALTGTAWIALIPGITVTFVLLYLHKYSWERMQHVKSAHLGILVIAVALLLVIPLVFLANVNLMMFPERWSQVRGLLDALTLPNVVPRYLHFLGASLVLTSLFCVAWFGRASYPVEDELPGLTRPQLRRMFYSVAFVVSLAQFVIGPVVLLTLPSRGLNAMVLLELGVGVTLAVPAVWLLWREVTDLESGRRFFQIVGLLTVTVVCMALGRHTYRYVALREHRREMARATAAWQLASEKARYELRTGVPRSGGAPDGAALFASSCSGCHAPTQRLVGPPLTEISTIYAGHPEGIVAWARAPGKKRADFPPMPSMAAVGDANLRAIAAHMLRVGGAQSPPP